MKDEQIYVQNIIGVTNGSLYSLAILAAKRALQLADGDKCLLERPTEKVLDDAIREISERRVKCAEKKTE